MNFSVAIHQTIQQEVIEDTPTKTDDVFVNPCAEAPVQAIEIMKYINMEPLRPLVDRLYSNNFRAKNAFRFPIMAGLRTLVYGKIKNHAFLSNIYHDLITIDGLAEVLGYDDCIPSYSQLYKFTNEMMEIKGVKALVDEMVRINIKEAKKLGLNIGEDITMDASPIQACPKDPDAQINGYYYKTMKIKKCYLWHNLRCLRTRLPLAFHLNHGNDDEGKFFLPFILKAKTLGANINKVYVDCGYATKENIASAKVHWDIDVVTNISNAWTPNLQATLGEIEKKYQKLWNKMRKYGIDLFVPGVKDEYMEMALIMASDEINPRRHQLVGDYYRNDVLAKHEECPDGYLDDYHQRNIVESTHGTEKRNGTIKRTEVRGIEHNTIQLGLHILAIHLVANVRLRHGITEGLTNIGYII
jgi:hypothetical protein